MSIPTQYTIDTPYMVGPVHCYTLECAGELVLFDTGPPTATGQRFLEENIDLERLAHVIVTHCHIDHYGQSDWLERHTNATVYLPCADIMKIRRHEERLRCMFDLLTEMGFDSTYLEKLHESFNRGVLFPPFPHNYCIAEQDIPSSLGIEVLPCPGHSQSDLVYVGNDWAITGDTLLRGIFQSPLLDVDLERGGRFKNYEAYCRSIVRLAGLHEKTILPGHRRNIESVERTLHFYIAKILHRVRQLQPVIWRNSVAGILNEVFAEMKDPFHVYLKASEIIFMRDFLEQPEQLQAALDKIGMFDAVAADFFQVTKN